MKLRSGVVYGPVNSRRLGISLGLNILPFKNKVCNFNCVYCQYGWTDYGLISEMKKEDYPSLSDIEIELKGFLGDMDVELDYITFSGHGEATLHPAFGEIVDLVNDIRDRYAPSSKTTILSNSTTVGNSEIRGHLSRLDGRVMKLDAGNRRMFEAYNGPRADVDFNSVVAGLAELEDVVIQSLFTKGEGGNFTDENLTDYIQMIKRINPTRVQLYSLDRDTPSKNIFKLIPEELTKIQILFKSAGIESTVYG
ncbi:MAG: hypothetical protein JW737_00180 [Acidobacteria bacterium]|nr:hypothetical protein [Acidobacteriota bacterium]